MTRKPTHQPLAFTPQPRRGVALILVVAVLGILFVAGAALLSQVTFSTKTLDAERQARENQAAIAAIEELALSFLPKGFIGTDGKAYSAPSRLVAHKRGQPDVPCDPGCGASADCVLTLPTFSEIPGLHPWLDVSEPLNIGLAGFKPVPESKLFSNPDYALQGRPGIYSDGSDPAVMGLSNAGNAWVPINGEFPLSRDADGDGIPDSVEFRITDEIMPPDLQRALAERISDDGYQIADRNKDPVRLWASLKIIPHGAMADVNASHEKILLSVWGLPSSGSPPLPSKTTAPPSYLPQTNEWWLRSRGPILPRSLPETGLVQDLLNSSLQAGIMNQLSAPAQRRWWLFNPETLAQDQNQSIPWHELMIMDPSGAMSPNYDIKHNLTTVSYDDLLMRPVMLPNDENELVDAIDLMRTDEVGQYAPSDKFALDNYPYGLDQGSGDPRLGRLQVSLLEMDQVLRDAPNVDTINDLAGLPLDDPTRVRFVRTFQDAFLLMLSNHRDFNRDGSPATASDPPDPQDDLERAITAAMLTANLIDFADGDNEPFKVPVIGRDGKPLPDPNASPFLPPTLFVYGFERQPFITGIYVRPVEALPVGSGVIDATRSSFAVELHNPYDDPIPLAGYFLTDLMNGASKYNLPAPIDRITDVDLADDPSITSIDSNSFLTVFAFKDPVALGGDALQLGGQWAIDRDSIIQLRREVDGGAVFLTVDEFNIAADVRASGPIADPDPQPTEFGTLWERDTSMWPVEISDQGLPRTKWLSPVPVAGQIVESAGATHTLGEVGPPVTLSTPDEFIMPVHADVMDSGTLVSAFPTTGSLLLIMRYAHLVDPNAGAPISMPFNRIALPYLSRNMKTEFDRLENGHMPVFDFAVDASNDLPRHRDSTPALVQGLDSLPWGQLVFDYFTGLPIKQCEDDDLCVNNAECPCPWYIATGLETVNTQPWVDQGGLRVRGRININAAPWVVLAGVPYRNIEEFALSFQFEMMHAANQSQADVQLTIGNDLAQAIVYYRESRNGNTNYVDVGDFETARDPCRTPTSSFAPRTGRGFLTIGELANVSHEAVASRALRMDAGANSAPPGSREASYIPAVSRLVTLSDWLTTKSHVFTVYGVIRGQYDHSASDPNAWRRVDSKALRFQTTVNRLPMFFGRTQPERIGTRISGGYADVRAE